MNVWFSTMDPVITPDEYMVVCISRQIRDGETVAQGLATPLVTAGYLLARLTHAPHLYFVSAIGQGMCRDAAPLQLNRVEELWLDRSLSNIGFARAVLDILPSLRIREFFRPGQIDPYGNFNNLAFGKDYITSGRQHPKMRLPGSGGIPDVTTFLSDICLYVPRHSRVTFVPQLDVCSGMGCSAQRTHGRNPVFMITDLGQFDFANGRLRLTSYHYGCDINYIQSKTGFELEIAPDVHETIPPNSEELNLLRNIIDPLGIRKLELLSGAPRKQLLRDIIAREQ